MARYALIKSGVVVNTIVADATFAASYSGDFDVLADCTGVASVGAGWTYASGTFTPPEQTAEEIKTEALNAIRARMAWGDHVIEEVRYYTLNLPDEAGMQLLEAFAPVITMLKLGILQAAGWTILGADANAILDSEYIPAGESVRQHFADLIFKGDPV